MARGDAKQFQDYPLKAGNGDYNNSADTFKIAFITDAYGTVSVTGTNPALNDFTQVSAGGNYPAGGLSLANITWSRTGAVSALDSDNVTMAAAAGNPNNARTGLLINVTAGNSCISAVDLTTDGTTPPDLVNNPITLNISDFFTGTVS